MLVLGMYDGLAQLEVNCHTYFFPNCLPRVLVNCPYSIRHQVARLKVNYCVHSMTTSLASIEVHCLDGLCVTLARLELHCLGWLHLSFDRIKRNYHVNCKTK